jgi:hypothetical protein
LPPLSQPRAHTLTLAPPDVLPDDAGLDPPRAWLPQVAGAHAPTWAVLRVPEGWLDPGLAAGADPDGWLPQVASAQPLTWAVLPVPDGWLVLLDAGLVAGAGWLSSLSPPPQLARAQALTLPDPEDWLAPVDVGLAAAAVLGPAAAAWLAPLEAALPAGAGLDPDAVVLDAVAPDAVAPDAVDAALDTVAVAAAVAGPGWPASPEAAELPGWAEAGWAALLGAVLVLLAPAEPVPPQLARTHAVALTPGGGLSTVAACAAVWPSSMTPPMLAATIRPR